VSGAIEPTGMSRLVARASYDASGAAEHRVEQRALAARQPADGRGDELALLAIDEDAMRRLAVRRGLGRRIVGHDLADELLVLAQRLAPGRHEQPQPATPRGSSHSAMCSTGGEPRALHDVLDVRVVEPEGRGRPPAADGLSRRTSVDHAVSSPAAARANQGCRVLFATRLRAGLGKWVGVSRCAPPCALSGRSVRPGGGPAVERGSTGGDSARTRGG
jgi:hypothetical protein